MSFFKLHKPLAYKYKPIYYDPKKEAREERMKRPTVEDKTETETKDESSKTYEPKILRRGVFTEMAEKERHLRRKQNNKSNFRVIIILMILLFIAYLLLK